MKTRVILLRQQSLTHAQIEAMWAVYRGFYHYSEAYFMDRIQKNTHFSLYLQDGKIVGFTGLRIDKTKIEGKRHLLLYFGQTVISRAFRGQSLIQTTALMLVLRFWKEYFLCKVWFWYDALSYKAYLASAKCAHEMYPSHRCTMTETERKIRDFAGNTWYGDTYCPETGTVSKPVNYLNDAGANVYPEDLKNPDVAFFVQANPRHTEGHGLLTFVPVSVANLGVLIRRYWKRLTGSGIAAVSKMKMRGEPESIATY